MLRGEAGGNGINDLLGIPKKPVPEAKTHMIMLYKRDAIPGKMD